MAAMALLFAMQSFQRPSSFSIFSEGAVSGSAFLYPCARVGDPCSHASVDLGIFWSADRPPFLILDEVDAYLDHSNVQARGRDGEGCRLQIDPALGACQLHRLRGLPACGSVPGLTIRRCLDAGTSRQGDRHLPQAPLLLARRGPGHMQMSDDL